MTKSTKVDENILKKEKKVSAIMVLPKYNLSYTAWDKVNYLTSKVKEKKKYIQLNGIKKDELLFDRMYFQVL